jgi:23S rRNA maturation mini-RNase III
MVNYYQRSSELTEQVFEYVSKEEFEQMWKAIQDIVNPNEQSRDRRQEQAANKVPFETAVSIMQ